MSTTKKAKDEFYLKNKVITKRPIDCSGSDRSVSKNISFTKLSLSSIYKMLKKLDFFKILPTAFGDDYESEENPCLTENQVKMINKKKAMQRRAILFIVQLLLMCCCLIHVFFFTGDIFGKNDILPKLLCSFLVLYDPPFYIAIIIILYYINNFKPANKLYEHYIIGFINRVKKILFRELPLFDKYSLFLSDAAKNREILTYYYKIDTPCDS